MVQRYGIADLNLPSCDLEDRPFLLLYSYREPIGLINLPLLCVPKIVNAPQICSIIAGSRIPMQQNGRDGSIK